MALVPKELNKEARLAVIDAIRTLHLHRVFDRLVREEESSMAANLSTLVEKTDMERSQFVLTAAIRIRIFQGLAIESGQIAEIEQDSMETDRL